MRAAPPSGKHFAMVAPPAGFAPVPGFPCIAVSRGGAALEFSRGVWCRAYEVPMNGFRLVRVTPRQFKPLHRLVALTYLPRPPWSKNVGFKDKSRRDDCSVDNVAWLGTRGARAALGARREEHRRQVAAWLDELFSESPAPREQDEFSATAQRRDAQIRNHLSRGARPNAECAKFRLREALGRRAGHGTRHEKVE